MGETARRNPEKVALADREARRDEAVKLGEESKEGEGSKGSRQQQSENIIFYAQISGWGWWTWLPSL